MATYLKRNININNKRYSGQNITVTNGKIIIDGQDVTPDSKNIYIHVDSFINEINVDVCDEISVGGDVGSVTTQSGNVNIVNNVNGNVKTMSGNVKCNNVTGNVNTMSGNVKKFK